MEPEKLEQWLEATSNALKRPRDDETAQPDMFLDVDPQKRRKLAPDHPKYVIEASSKPRRRRSDGDLSLTREARDYSTRSIVIDVRDMAPPNEATSFPSAMPPPPLPRPASSRASSRNRSQSTCHESQKNNGTSSSAYRTTVLQRHKVFIKHDELDADVRTAVDIILSTDEQRPLWSDIEASEVAAAARAVEDSTEEEVIMALGLQFFPAGTTRSLPMPLAEKRKLPFAIDTMPYVPPSEWLSGVQIPRVANPTPDFLYGYTKAAFTPEQLDMQLLLETVVERSLATTVSKLLWGFFAVEFKAQATGGTIYAATNQCAGAGAACVNAMEQMFEVAATSAGSQQAQPHQLPSPQPPSPRSYEASTQHSRADTMCFTLAIDGQTAALYVNWINRADDFYCTRVRAYWLFEPGGARDLKRDVDAIIEWGLGPRLTAIRGALDARIAKARAAVEGAASTGVYPRA